RRSRCRLRQRRQAAPTESSSSVGIFFGWNLFGGARPRSSGTTPTLQASIDFDAGLRYGGPPISRPIGKPGPQIAPRPAPRLDCDLASARLVFGRFLPLVERALEFFDHGAGRSARGEQPKP